MFDNFLTPEQQSWRDTCHRFMDQEITREYLLRCDMDRALQEVSRNGIQIMGGFGMLPEAGMEHYFREGMQSTVGGGTSQIQRTIIAKTMKI